MKEAFDHLQLVFPDMPPACEQALMAAARSVTEKPRVSSLRPVRRAVLLAAAMLTIACAAGAAFYPQIIPWFASHYGAEYAPWMEQGSVASPNASAAAEGAVFSVDEVLVRGRGLYVMGAIRAAEGYVLVDSECSAQEPWGYNIHYGEEAPEGTPSIAQVAEATGSAIRYVHCDLRGIGVDGGALLLPGSWGYGATVQRDGSIVFTIEAEDGLAVEPGREYTLELSAQTWGAHADGSMNHEDMTETIWRVTVTPEELEQP